MSMPSIGSVASREASPRIKSAEHPISTVDAIAAASTITWFIALGNVTSFAGQSGLAEHALPFKYLGDALVLRNHAIHVLEEADIEPDPEMRRSLLTFVVAGGGFSGVEAVAELNDFVRVAAKSFRNVRAEEIRVLLLHAGGLILPELSESLAAFAQRLLMKRGVEIRLNTRLDGATAETALLAGGERISTRTLVSTVPSGPNPLVAALHCRKDRGRIVTEPHLELPEYPGVWAVGDCALILDAEDGPAEPAHGPARDARGSLRGREHGREPSGNAQAQLRVQSARQDGRPRPPLGRRRGLRREAVGLPRLVALADDLSDEAPGPRSEDPRGGGLDAESAAAARHRPAPDGPLGQYPPRALRAWRGHLPGGRHGDWLYIVVDGEVEVVQRVPGQGDVTLRRLGPGDCFGEIALLGDHVRTATTRSLTAVNVLAVDRDAFQALFSTLPPLRAFVERLIEERMAPMTTHHLDGEKPAGEPEAALVTSK